MSEENPLSTELVITAEDILKRAVIVAHRNGYDDVKGMSGLDNHRGELDAVQVGGQMLIMHGGEFQDGPTYYVSRQGRIDLVGGEFIPTDDEATYYDTTQDAMRAVSRFIAGALAADVYDDAEGLS